MNHLGDTNKMVSDTPRTDEVTRTYGDASVEWEEKLVPVEACRAIERELNAANAKIKRLEEAGDKIVEAGWSVQDWSGMCVVWAKAKEDKL